jgi:hydroxymethylpyrimidine pyrophosphatase-like HAD family hydrolase
VTNCPSAWTRYGDDAKHGGAVGYRAWLDIGPEGVSKASALVKVANRLGVVPEDCLAIGDGRNDVEMLLWAGRGVAVGQAPPEVEHAADDVTEPVTSDGAAVELERWFG